LRRVEQELVAPQEAAGEDVPLIGGRSPELERVAPQHQEGLDLRAFARRHRRAREPGRQGRMGQVWHPPDMGRNVAGTRRYPPRARRTFTAPPPPATIRNTPEGPLVKITRVATTIVRSPFRYGALEGA